MKRLLIFFILTALILSGCANNSAPDLMEEAIETFDVTQAISEPIEDVASSEIETTAPDESAQATEEPQTPSQIESIDGKFAQIDFYLVSGFYSRNVIQEEIEYMEMFSLDKNNFVRIAENELEQEVFAYNYLSDDFTYMYYFDGELISKTVFNIDTGAVLLDPDGYTELLKTDAEEIKVYFFALLDIADLTIEDLTA